MIDTALAKRYAKALVEIAQEQNALDKYAEELDTLCSLVETSRDFRELLSNPVFTKEDKKNITGQVLQKMNADAMVTNFICLLIDRKRIDQLAGIANAFREKVDDIRGITRGEVISAEPLAAQDLSRITATLAEATGKQVIVTTKVDPSLIGGLVARVGDMVFDGTIRTQLSQLKESLKG